MAHTELGLRERRSIEDMLNAKMPVDKIAVEWLSNCPLNKVACDCACFCVDKPPYRARLVAAAVANTAALFSWFYFRHDASSSGLFEIYHHQIVSNPFIAQPCVLPACVHTTLPPSRVVQVGEGSGLRGNHAFLSAASLTRFNSTARQTASADKVRLPRTRLRFQRRNRQSRQMAPPATQARHG